MNSIKIHKGLDLPIAGKPLQCVQSSPTVRTVALVGPDYIGMKPTMSVQVGDQVKLGQVLFTDKKTPGVKYTSPAGGTVIAINRGEKRVFQSIEIAIDENEPVADFCIPSFDALTDDSIVAALVDTGLWTAFRTRPFSKVPAPDTRPNAIFVTAIDTNPLAAEPDTVMQGRENDFIAGLQILSVLAGDKPVFVCQSPENAILDGKSDFNENVKFAWFSGKHPAGLVGTHIHFLCPASRKNVVWHLNYQDVAAIGTLFTTGVINPYRIISLAGPAASQPRLVKVRLGANLDDITYGECESDKKETPVRIVSGSVLNGRESEPGLNFLGRYHSQVTLLKEGFQRRLFGWIMPKFVDFSTKWTNASLLLPTKQFKMNTDVFGGHRAIFSIGSMDEVMPLDILPAYLVRALIVGDLEMSEQLGALELDEEDLALCTYVDPGKNDYGPMLRSVLTTIDKEG